MPGRTEQRRLARARRCLTIGKADGRFLSTTRTTTSSRFTANNLDERLAQAHERFAARDFLRSFALCKEVLDAQPDSVDALVLFAQLCFIAGEYLTAVQCFRLANHIDPDNAAARALLAEDIAQEGYRAVLAIDPRLANHTSAYVFAAAVPQAARIETILREVIALDPQFAPAHAALGNMLGRAGNLDASLDSYARAVALDPLDAAIRLGYAERLRLHGQTNHAREHFDRALELERTYEEAPTGAEELRLFALCAPDFWENNILVDMLVDREHVHLTKHFVGEHFRSVPPHGVVMSVLADPENAGAIDAASRFLAESASEVINPPDLLTRTSRTYLCEQRLAHPHLLIPATLRTNTAKLAAQGALLAYPFLMRPVGSHRGEGLELIRDEQHLQAYVRASPEVDVFTSVYVDYVSADAYFRKYRFLFIEGRPFPYHMAISSQWMVHYFTAPMEKHKWMREEEAHFLRSPFEVFGVERWDALRVIAQEVGLDYFGLDCTIVADKVLIFEANTNMLVQNFYDERFFGYKTAAFGAITQAFNAMLRKRRSPR